MNSVTIDQALQTAMAYHQAGRMAEAEALYRQVLAVQPQNPDALHLLGLIAHQVGQQAAAGELISQAIALRPEDAAFHSNLGEVYRLLGRTEEAIASHRRALAIRPDFAEAYNNLGIALFGAGRFEEAVAAYERALALRPHYPEAHNNLGNVHLTQGQFEAAKIRFEQSLALAPSYIEAHNNLGFAWLCLGDLDEAAACYERAFGFGPDYHKAHNNYALVLAARGQMSEAVLAHERAAALAPDEPSYHSNVVFAKLSHPVSDPAMLRAELERWNRRHETPRRRFQKPHTNDPDPDRRLRIGYVSPDLREHPIGQFLVPLFAHHDHDALEITCYAELAKEDDITEQLRACADHWHETTGLSEQELADLIRADGIDILVDLSLHTAGNRLPVFARKPAPIQVTYLAYPGSSGLDAMDYRLTDPYLDPPEAEDDDYSETSIRLPTYWCYQAPEQAPDVSDRPAPAQRSVTFGCLNNFSKVNGRS